MVVRRNVLTEVLLLGLILLGPILLSTPPGLQARVIGTCQRQWDTLRD